jgi:hypothetical protein
MVNTEVRLVGFHPLLKLTTKERSTRAPRIYCSTLYSGSQERSSLPRKSVIYTCRSYIELGRGLSQSFALLDWTIDGQFFFLEKYQLETLVKKCYEL